MGSLSKEIIAEAGEMLKEGSPCVEVQAKLGISLTKIYQIKRAVLGLDPPTELTPEEIERRLTSVEFSYIHGLGSFTTYAGSKTVKDIIKLLENYIARQDISKYSIVAINRLNKLRHMDPSICPYREKEISFKN